MAKKVVTINITRQTKAVTRKGFGTLMLIGRHKVFNERVRAYTAADAMLVDGFESTDPEYIAGLAFFSQNPNTGTFLIGRHQADQAVLSVLTAVDSTDYTTTINGTIFTFTSGVSATPLTIAAGLKIAIDAGTEPVIVTDNIDGTLDVDPTVAGVAFTITALGPNLIVVKPFAVTESIVDAYTAIKQENADFYAVAMTNKVQADVESIAAQVLTEKRIFGTSSTDSGILATTLTDIAAVLNANNNERTFVLYTHLAGTYPEVAWMSRQLSTDPGSSTWKFKTLIGQVASPLTSTESTNATNKKCNTYEKLNGVDITLEGTMASGEFIDIIRGIDWLEARMAERIFSKFVNLAKIPFTNGGIAIIEAEIRGQLNDGIASGLLANDPAPIVTKPLASEVSNADKVGRTLPDMAFSATLQGAIHFVTVDGIVAV